MPQWYRKAFGDCPGSKVSLSILEFWKLLTMYFLFTLIIYPSGVFNGVEELIVIVFFSYDKDKINKILYL